MIEPKAPIIQCTHCRGDEFCPTCNGAGFVWLQFPDKSGRVKQGCDDCKGTGLCAKCYPLGLGEHRPIVVTS